MKRSGILNPRLSAAVARLGHTDTVIVADCGLPVPREIPVIDLALVFGVPRFTQVLDALRPELVVDRVTIADEALGTQVETWIRARFDAVDTLSHEDLKTAVRAASFVVRTGETTSFANAILHCGVPF